MPPERILALAGLVLSLLLLGRFGSPAMRSWQIFAGTKHRRLADAGPLAVAPPPAIAPAIEDVRALGFDRIGERYLQLPGSGLHYDWVFAEASGATYIVVVPSRVVGAFVVCYSVFPDGTWLQTQYPRGETLERRDLVVSFGASNIGDTLSAHRRRLAALEALHGSPRPIRTMADALWADDDYRTRHAGKTLRRLTVSIATPALAAIALAVICAALLLLGR